MKKIITLFTCTLLTITSINAQREVDSLTYENTQDINFFKKIKNRTLVKKYKTVNENVIKIGDTIVLGNPTSQELIQKRILLAMEIKLEVAYLKLEVHLKKLTNL